MGSLMAGWDSPVMDPEVAKYQRNKSFTRGEIEAFWRSHRREEDGNATDSSPSQSSQENTPRDPGKKNVWQASTPRGSDKKDFWQEGTSKTYSRSSSMPMPVRRDTLMDDKDEHEKLKKPENKSTSCWWTRSNWAFLNEPPVIETEGPQHRHAPKHCGTFVGNPKMGGHRQITT